MKLVLPVVVAAMVVPAALAAAQDTSATPAASAECAPSFDRTIHPHGAQTDFSCRTRMIACPVRADHYALIVPDPPIESENSVQFGYRCHYFPLRR